ncbi:MAG: ABC transporter permease [Chloroflexi bacterium]|nr:ABC transporter permease [Chloroflexota bacterium]
MRLRRIKGVARRQWLTLRHSLPRAFDVFYWPIVEVIVWGLVTVYLLAQVGATFLPSVFLSGMILWIVLYRAQEDLAVAVLEESWAGNVLNLFGSPLEPLEYVFGSFLVGLVKTALAAGAMSLLAWALYGFQIWSLGVSLIGVLVALILSGWALGMVVIGLILRYGRRMDVLAWSFAHLVQPLSCAVYPVKVLPPVLQALAGLLPSAHAFEAARAAVAGQPDWRETTIAIASGVLALLLAGWYAQRGLVRAREMGRLASVGE